MGFTILVIEDEDHFRSNLSDFLGTKGYDVVPAATYAEGRKLIRNGTGDIILLDVQLPDGYGPNLLKDFSHELIHPPVIVLTGQGNIDMAVESMKMGAHDFLTKPIQFDRLVQSLERACELVSMRRELAQIRSEQIPSTKFVVGKSQKVRALLHRAKRAAEASVSVLISGETGTGKEIVARFIHEVGPRSKRPFVPINCAAIQSTVIESELFGYESGAFTGADKRKIGLMEVADTGILFLDEISSMPLDMQAKLLRALEDHEIWRVGSTKDKGIHVDVQVVAASNRNLMEMVENHEFREDLFYRLRVVELDMPALRDRVEDIPGFVGFFMKEKNAQLGTNVNSISQQALKALQLYQWPGNIRQLRNVIERALLFCDEDQIGLGHLPDEIAQLVQ